MRKRANRSTLIIFVVVLIGIIGFVLTQKVAADIQSGMEQQIRKLVGVARLAQMYYVEDIDWDEAVSGAVTGMLEKLDPHSVYIPEKKAEENKENFSGKYEGIGIQYDVIDDYLTVISPISGSPSDELGIRAGDRIIKIDGESAIGISREAVPAKLKGPKGTTVQVTIVREGIEKPFDLTITRDVIPISTITAAFMEDDSTGYIGVSRFAAITSRELEEKLIDLESRHMRRLVLDLRWNSGGYLHEAVKMAGKFIPGHKLIVETRGRSQNVEEEYYADQFGRRTVRNYPLIVLINQGSASASEIVAGAIQDYDRGLIIGENSFGKGLVQKEFFLQDGSAVRITTAKYYTPSGRCIQRNYKGKKLEDYYRGVPDSTWATTDSLKKRPLYYTQKGRTVYGGGGIQPDIFLHSTPFSHVPDLTNKLLQKRLFFEFANEYAAHHPEISTDLYDFRKNFEITASLYNDFKSFSRSKNVSFTDAEMDQDTAFVKLRLKAELAKHFWGNDGYYLILLSGDQQYRNALNYFGEARKLASLE